MKKIICLYYTRTGKTKSVCEELSNKMENVELVEYTDGRDRTGAIEYIKACLDSLTKKDIKIKDIKTKFDLKEYDIAIIATPIWVEDCSKICKSFLLKYKNDLPCKIYFVVTHMSKIDYKDKILKLDNYLGRNSQGFLSICTKKKIDIDKIDEFTKKIKEKIDE